MLVTDTMKLEMIELRQNGYGNKDIAKIFGITPRTVAKYIGKEPKGFKSKEDDNSLPFNITMNTICEMLDLCDAGKTNAEIAETMGLSEEDVECYLGSELHCDNHDDNDGDVDLNTLQYYEQVRGNDILYSMTISHTGQTITILRGEDALVFQGYEDFKKFMDELEIVRSKVRNYMDKMY